ncbi:hypothetical protein P0D87_27235 [Paraburkholderia sp. RL17-368-BIF-A]
MFVMVGPPRARRACGMNLCGMNLMAGSASAAARSAFSIAPATFGFDPARRSLCLANSG